MYTLYTVYALSSGLFVGWFSWWFSFDRQLVAHVVGMVSVLTAAGTVAA